MRSFLICVVVLCFSTLSLGQVLAPQAEELSFRYRAEFLFSPQDFTPEDARSSQAMAQLHASHLFGLMHSRGMSESFGLDYDMVGGIGSPRAPVIVTAQRATTAGDRREGKIRVAYEAQGKMLVHSTVARRILRAGHLEWSLPKDISDIYDKKCTDTYYQDLGDFWYFWDPFRAGCEYLAEEKSDQVVIEFKPTRQIDRNVSPRLDLLRGANGNGTEFSVFTIFGYNIAPSPEKARKSRDEGRQNYRALSAYYKASGFRLVEKRFEGIDQFEVWSKELEVQGRLVQAQVTHVLADSGVDAQADTFAQVFKEAVETGDVVIYAGHSGLGGNLDIPGLEARVGKFQFQHGKRQIFFFESCSSYSYYLETFAAEKTKARIDIVTNGLSSYFHTGAPVIQAFLDVFWDGRIKDKKWLELLKQVEAPLQGGSYLLNVGGL